MLRSRVRWERGQSYGSHHQDAFPKRNGNQKGDDSKEEKEKTKRERGKSDKETRNKVSAVHLLRLLWAFSYFDFRQLF
jgi:hypothetical protein